MECNKTALILGGLSSIGQDLLEKACKSFTNVLVTENGSNYEKLNIWCTGLRERSPKTVITTFQVDVTDVKQIKALGEHISENEIEIGVLYYLPGINILTPALKETEENWDRIQNVNIKGFFFVSQMAAGNMMMHGGGNIIGIASQHGVVANVDRAAYCASKAAMIHLAKELSLEWAKYGIRVNTVSPTMILSEKNENILNSPHARKDYLSRIPLRQYARPEDVSDAAIFLSSAGARMITGQNLIVDGGWTIG